MSYRHICPECGRETGCNIEISDDELCMHCELRLMPEMTPDEYAKHCKEGEQG